MVLFFIGQSKRIYCFQKGNYGTTRNVTKFIEVDEVKIVDLDSFFSGIVADLKRKQRGIATALINKKRMDICK